MIGCALRWIRRLRGGLDDDRRRWPPLDPGPTTPRIAGARASATCMECDAGHTFTADCRYRLEYSAPGGRCAPLSPDYLSPAEDPPLTRLEAQEMAEADCVEHRGQCLSPADVVRLTGDDLG